MCDAEFELSWFEVLAAFFGAAALLAFIAVAVIGV